MRILWLSRSRTCCEKTSLPLWQAGSHTRPVPTSTSAVFVTKPANTSNVSHRKCSSQVEQWTSFSPWWWMLTPRSRRLIVCVVVWNWQTRVLALRCAPRTAGYPGPPAWTAWRPLCSGGTWRQWRCRLQWPQWWGLTLVHLSAHPEPFVSLKLRNVSHGQCS